ncbi:hypothetical protein OBBRIDRAFT_834059 [Obba rivulosa]|uniref:Uncharacterized protein n=1 Tax=Obba rivulosa TaxID=1052685 RepID=A0A8E2DM25_9APHY|nr:hypothetical protein OBBRIDRAFT_834059 [Obba rivulosa]
MFNPQPSAASARQAPPSSPLISPSIPAPGTSDTPDASASGDNSQATISATPSDGGSSGSSVSPSSTPSSVSSGPSSSPSNPPSSSSQLSPSDNSSSQPTPSSTPAQSSTSSAPPTSSSSSPSPSVSSSLSPSSAASSTSSLASSSAPTQSSTSNSASSLSFPTPTPSPSASSGGSGGSEVFITVPTTITSNGTLVTTFTTIPTTLSDNSDSPGSPNTTRTIVIGSVVGGAAFLVLALCLVLFYRRHQNKKFFFFGRNTSTPRSMLLAGEDFDDYDLHPPMQRYSDYPASLTSHTAQSLEGTPLTPRSDRDTYARATPGPAPAPGPLFPLRASESGSIFREAVWPPPGEASKLVDPLVAGSSQVDLGRIVDDVMGPRGAASHSSHAHPPVAYPPLMRTRDGREASYTSNDSLPQAMHSRSTSHTGLLQDQQEEAIPDSPIESRPRPLFVTNMDPTSPDSTSPVSPPITKNWLDREPRRVPRESTDEDGSYPMGEAM